MIMANETIHMIMTGGTIDSYYEGAKDTVIPLEHSVLPAYFRGMCFSDEEIVFTEICMKDSRNLTREDLEKLLQTIEDSEHRKLIVTHGTYTMPDTARYLKARIRRDDQTIVLTGSMTPLQGFTPSDAPFNLGYAMSEIRRLDLGIYVAMHGNTFTSDEVAKDMRLGRFYSIFGEKQKK